MWALIEDGSITKHLSGNRGITIGDIQYSRNIFSFRWSNEEREAIGIYEIVFNPSITTTGSNSLPSASVAFASA